MGCGTTPSHSQISPRQVCCPSLPLPTHATQHSSMSNLMKHVHAGNEFSSGRTAVSSSTEWRPRCSTRFFVTWSGRLDNTVWTATSSSPLCECVDEEEAEERAPSSTASVSTNDPLRSRLPPPPSSSRTPTTSTTSAPPPALAPPTPARPLPRWGDAGGVAGGVRWRCSTGTTPPRTRRPPSGNWLEFSSEVTRVCS